MSHKISLLIITLLIAGVSIQFWSSDRAANKAAAGPLQQNSPLVAFDRASINVVEPDAGETKAITVDVVISNAPERGEKVQVTALSADASAIAGIDFEAVAEYLTFPAGSTDSQSFDVVISGNNISQPDRAFVVFLTNPVNATVGIPGAITITILDNDPIPVTPTSKSWNYLPIIRGSMTEPTATPQPPGTAPVYKGELGTEDLTIDTLGAGATDRWNLDLIAGEMISITVAPGAVADIALSVLDSSGELLISNHNEAAAGDVETIKDLNISNTGIHQLLIRTELGTQTDYALMLMDSESYSFFFRDILRDNSPRSDSLAADNDHFWFFNAQSGECVSFSITPDSGEDPYIELYDPDGARMLTIDDNGEGEAESLDNYTLMDAGLYSIRVAEFDFRPMSYQIVLTKPCSEPDPTAAPLYTPNGRTRSEIHVFP